MNNTVLPLLALLDSSESEETSLDTFMLADSPSATEADLTEIPPDQFLDCWSRINGNAHLLVTSQRLLLCCDSAGLNELAREESLRHRGRRIETTDPSELPNLQRLLDVPEGGTNTYCLPTRRRGGHLVMRSSLLKVVGATRVVGVSFHGTGRDFRPQWADVRALFNLTSSEHRIVQKLLAGMGAERIAADQNLSINTVRTHISHAYEKLGVSSRDELWRQLAPYRIH